MPYQVHNYRKSSEQKFVEGLLKGMWWIVSLPFRLVSGSKSKSGNAQAGGLDKAHIHHKWQEIEELMRLGSPSNYSRAVLEGDKLLDYILKGLKVPGLTMGDRLKAGKSRFSDEAYDAAWKAHKVRNEIVHNSQYQITDFMAKDAISNFQKAIGEIDKNLTN